MSEYIIIALAALIGGLVGNYAGPRLGEYIWDKVSRRRAAKKMSRAVFDQKDKGESTRYRILSYPGFNSSVTYYVEKASPWGIWMPIRGFSEENDARNFLSELAAGKYDVKTIEEIEVPNA